MTPGGIKRKRALPPTQITLAINGQPVVVCGRQRVAEVTPHPARPSADGRVRTPVAVHLPRFLGSDGPIRSDLKSDSPRRRLGSSAHAEACRKHPSPRGEGWKYRRVRASRSRHARASESCLRRFVAARYLRGTRREPRSGLYRRHPRITGNPIPTNKRISAGKSSSAKILVALVAIGPILRLRLFPGGNT